jgi:nucleoid-associated protein YgaU
MFGKQKRFANMGAVGRDTSQFIDETIEKQQEIKKSWSTRRPKTMAVSNPKPAAKAGDKQEPIAVLPTKPSAIFNDEGRRGGLSAYWFPLLCAAAVISVSIWTFWPASDPKPVVPAPVVNVVDKSAAASAPAADKAPAAVEKSAEKTEKTETRPAFDIVRVESGGAIVVAGRYLPGGNISVKINKKIVATIKADKNGEFVYSPKNKLKPGNYAVRLLVDKSESDVVFLYVDERADQSLSLLMTGKSSRVLQAPKNLADGALAVSKIDYVANKRLIVQGRALPRLRVSVSLNDKLLGMTRVSDHKNFGLGAGVGELKPGEKYSLSVRLHDAEDNVVGKVDHEFTMPEMTAADETFYVVRRDDCLWVIAKNFYGKGIQFSIIVAANDIKNPNLIYPNQKFKIPVK